MFGYGADESRVNRDGENMLYINKGAEPASLLKYRLQRDAYYDGFDDKDAIRDCLLREQGCLCAYCMRRIEKKHMKIEHWKPQSNLTDKEKLDYKNMLGVCMGHQPGDKEKDETCDTHRKDRKLIVNPLDRNTIDKIKYKPDGTIFSSEETINNDLDKILNLNCEKSLLKINRKSALKALLQELNKFQNKGLWDNAMLEKYIYHYENVNRKGEKAEYAGILLWYLKKKRHN